MSQNKSIEKQRVHDFWNKASCGEVLYLSNCDKVGYQEQSNERYRLEGEMIFALARFRESKDLDVLEIGVGLGSDHQKFAEAGAALYGIDLTERAIDHTIARLSAFDLKSNLAVGDAENLSFPNNSFDQVYSWGVLHHSPDTPKAISEVWRVLKPDGLASIMIYHKWSIVGFMLWIRYGLLRLRPWLTLNKIYSTYLESPGTKAYSVEEAKDMLRAFRTVVIKTPLTHGDLLESDVGQRHRGLMLKLARLVWPRWFINLALPNAGLFMLIEARK